MILLFEHKAHTKRAHRTFLGDVKLLLSIKR